jgi:membrane-associated phospholipid phosphatase
MFAVRAAPMALILGLGFRLGVAAADPEPAAPSQVDRVSPSWWFDRDALTLFWAPVIGTAVVDLYVRPRQSPLLFDPAEGGKGSRRSREVPGIALTLGGALVAGAIALGDDPSRYHHAKGLAQSLATSGFLVVSAKRVFGRQRPDFDPQMPTDDGRRSFPSGHTTRAVATLAYSALYLRYHGFDQWRDPGQLPWWEVASYAGLGALAVGFAGERVVNHRHHLTDVVAGGLVGAASSALLFYFNERRYRRALDAEERVDEPAPLERPLRFTDELSLRPELPPAEGPMLTFGGAF